MTMLLRGQGECRDMEYILVEERILVGRAEEAEMRLDRPQVSRQHAEITVDDGAVRVRDLGSHNGTAVNGNRISGVVTLAPGDRVEFANLVFTLLDGSGAAASRPVTMLGGAIKPNVELSWDEVNMGRRRDQGLRSLLFRVLAEAGNLLTVPRAPREMYGPILDLVETALLGPERIFVLLLEDEDEPVEVASRVQGRDADALVLSTTMVRQVLTEKKSFLTSDALNDPGCDQMMSMVIQGIRSAIAVPLFDNEDVIGILYADDTRPDRAFSRDQLSAFTLLANIIAVALTHARYHELEEEKRRQDAELATASGILDHMLPSVLASLEPCYEVLASLESCYEVGGDLYDAQMLDDGRYAFLVGDVTGKGVGAALLVSHVLSLSRFMLRENWEPEPLVTRLNNEIYRCTDHVRFTPLFLGYLNPVTGHVSYVNAGHNPPLHVKADGTTAVCPPTGLPVGMLEGMEYKTGEFTLGPGDMLAVFSDGVTETQNEAEDDFGDDRLEEFLIRERRTALPDLFATLQTELAAYRGTAPIGDDVTDPGDDSS